MDGSSSFEHEICKGIQGDFVYVKETPSPEDEVVTPDMLWRLYDCNDMMMLCTRYESFRTQGADVRLC